MKFLEKGSCLGQLVDGSIIDGPKIGANVAACSPQLGLNGEGTGVHVADVDAIEMDILAEGEAKSGGLAGGGDCEVAFIKEWMGCSGKNGGFGVFGFGRDGAILVVAKNMTDVWEKVGAVKVIHTFVEAAVVCIFDAVGANSILYFLRVAWVADIWSYQLERTSGSEAEDQEERERKSVAYWNHSAVAERDATKRARLRQMHVEKAQLNLPVPAFGVYTTIQPEAVDIKDKSSWTRLARSEEENHLQEAKDEAGEAVKCICSIEQVNVEEQRRRLRKLSSIFMDARADIMRDISTANGAPSLLHRKAGERLPNRNGTLNSCDCVLHTCIFIFHYRMQTSEVLYSCGPIIEHKMLIVGVPGIIT